MDKVYQFHSTHVIQEYNSLPDEFREIAKEYEDVQHDIQALLEIRPRS